MTVSPALLPLPILYHKTRSGDLQTWKVWTEGAAIITEFGRLGGKMQRASKQAIATNAGRSNERNPAEQAMSEAKSMHQRRLDQGYAKTPEAAKEPVWLPMLAQDYHKRGGKLAHPVLVQPKFDGVRCLAFVDANGTVELRSRRGKVYKVPHIEEAVQRHIGTNVSCPTVLDGELYLHGAKCQSIVSLVRRQQAGSLLLKYHIYDVPILGGDEAKPQVERLDALVKLVNPMEKPDIPLIRVPTYGAGDSDVVHQYERQFVGEGYEGAIVRATDAQYQWGQRSPDLLKVKSFQDAEFEVVGCTQGVGKMAGCAIWVCRNDKSDSTFQVTNKATMAMRQAMWKDRDSYVGQRLTVRFFDRTEDGMPRFPVGVAFRGEEDQPGEGD